MQSKLALRSLLLCRLSLEPHARALSTTPYKTVHAEPPQGENAEFAAQSAAAEEEERRKNQNQSKTTPLSEEITKKPPLVTSPKLERTEVPLPDPTFDQKRPRHRGGGGGELEEEKVKEYREYYKEHKPSPISGFEFADTRKPITRATDGTASGLSEKATPAVVEDSVDAALERAERLFREAAERGNPDLPHSRALAKLLAARADRTDAF